MRPLRMLAVLLSNLLDRVRRALLSWAGVEVSAETHDGEAVDDRPAVWLEYARARTYSSHTAGRSSTASPSCVSALTSTPAHDSSARRTRSNRLLSSTANMRSGRMRHAPRVSIW